ncbi:MAG: helix-turn-helix domain-containing protein [Sphingobacteriales bacterium]
MTGYLYAGCATLILFISLLIAGKKGKGLSDYIFLTWLLIMLGNVATFIIILKYNYPASFAGRILVEFSEASVFMHGPVFLFYTLSLATSNFRLGFRQALHLIPFTVCLGILISGIVFTNGVGNTTREVLTIVKMISLLAYTSIVITQLKKHRNRVERIFSNTESKYLGWLKFLAWGIIVVWIISSVGLLLYNFSGFKIPQYGALAGNLALCGLIFLIGYFGVRQEAIFNFAKKNGVTILPEEIEIIIVPQIIDNSIIPETIPPDGNASEPILNDKYKNSGLSKQKSLELFEALGTLMKDRKPYQDTELTLFTLAKQLSIHPNHLSQIINQHHNQNFFDYINEHRVNDVKEALFSGKYDNLSLLGIGHEFGFNSKASFNRAFKKFTGMTPSAFRKTAH